VGETRVDLLHLLEDLRDAYAGAVEETILTEIVANSLDSGASRIQLNVDPPSATLTVIDDGRGMRRRELARYHDVAASTKTRGEGIGFAGVGIKLGLLVCEEVLTESRRGKQTVATRWHLASRHRAPWKWVPPSGLVGAQGTAVRLKLQNALSPLLDAAFIATALQRHYQPLFDPTFGALLVSHYPRGVAVEVNGRALEGLDPEPSQRVSVEVRLVRKRKPSAVGHLFRSPSALPDGWSGIGISTLGKVIKQGWDWLGISPAAPEHVGGLIEVPALAGCLTLNKADFIRVGIRGATYLAYRKAIQEAVSRQLAAWGDARDGAEDARRRVARPLERDIERVLMELADEFPLLATLVDHRRDGQRKLPIARSSADAGRALVATSIASAREPEGEEQAPDDGTASQSIVDKQEDTADGLATDSPVIEPPPAPPPPGDATIMPAAPGVPRAARPGLGIQFEERPDEPELAHLVESTVWINAAHPAYRRAAASRQEGYHVALASALALAALAVEPARERAFVTAFLARWGEAVRRGDWRRQRLK
jgi:hypothetical protein